jgi:hypothetical protein
MTNPNYNSDYYLCYTSRQCSGSMPLTNGSGIGFGSCYFVIALHEAKSFSAYYRYVFKEHLHHFKKIKSPKEVTQQNSRNQGFLKQFLLDDRRMIK